MTMLESPRVHETVEEHRESWLHFTPQDEKVVTDCVYATMDFDKNDLFMYFHWLLFKKPHNSLIRCDRNSITLKYSRSAYYFEPV